MGCEQILLNPDLTKREKEFLHFRFTNGGEIKMSLRAVALHLSITTQRVHQIQNNVLRKTNGKIGLIVSL